MAIADCNICKAEVGRQCTHILSNFPNTATPPPFSTSLFQLTPCVHYKEKQQHLPLALAAFAAHPDRISRKMESCNNMVHHIGWKSFPSAVDNTGGCKESMWSLFGWNNKPDLRFKIVDNLKQLADRHERYRIHNWIFTLNIYGFLTTEQTSSADGDHVIQQEGPE